MVLQNRTQSTSADQHCAGTANVGFVGIGKTGSIFMAAVLELFAHEQMLTTTHPTEASKACELGARFGWHHASAQLWEHAFGSAWTKAYTFSLVRNPWVRLVSHWAFHLSSRSPLDGGLFHKEERQQMKSNETHSIQAFRSWVRHIRQQYPPGSTEAWRFTTADAHGNEQLRSFSSTQLSWLVDGDGHLLVDAVYPLEDLRERWPELQAHVCSLRNVSYERARMEPIIRALDHPSHHRQPADYYDDETAAIVVEYMSADIQTFGYKRPVARPVAT